MRILVKKLGLNPRSLVRLGTFPMVLGLFAAPVLAEGDYCWKKSETRGVGTIPTEVEPGRVKIGALSYSQCPANTKRVGFDCHSVCPPGMRDDGLFCRATEYGRGAGYVLWQKDKCNRENAQGCEKNGLLWYPKCRDGYTAFGSNICRPNKPQCSALGLNPGIDLSCAKKVVIGDPQPLVCAPGALNDAGLCYPACKPGFDGAGPVCWGKCSTGFVECGAGCASDAKTCAEVTSDQVLSTIDLAVNIATLGRSGWGKSGCAFNSAGKQDFDVGQQSKNNLVKS